MAKWALMEGNNVLNVWDSKPTDLVHPDILKLCVSVPSTVKAGDVKDPEKGTYAAPVEPASSTPPDTRLFSKQEFMVTLTAAERTKYREIIKTDDDLADFDDMFNYGPRKIVDSEVQADLDLLVTKSIISSATKTKIDNLHKVA
ncbi:MAG: hypothetical protein CMB76_07105 [Euryarchaeota archaeon]|mgnify:CR=1 FL=1|nr:hypothetical protein [Euryarchaeota archaeon]|tara:strand:+ start:2938 stop:3369 length:432 start_codon:yes stop_codon:yes gene_type:complete